MAENPDKTKITDAYLKDFATQKLQPFIQELTSEPHRLELTGYTQDGKVGNDVNWNYNQLLTGNAKGGFSAATQLQARFRAFATSLDQRFTEIETAARTLVQDLLMVEAVLTKGEDHAAVTAAEMNADLSNVTFGGTGGTGRTGGISGTGGSGAP